MIGYVTFKNMRKGNILNSEQQISIATGT